MRTRILGNLFWISATMIVGGIIIAVIGTTSPQEFLVEFLGMKIKATDGGIALALVGGLTMFRAVMKVQEKLPTDTQGGFSHLTILVTDKETGIGIPNAKVVIKLQEGSKPFTSDRDGNTKIEFLETNRTNLAKVKTIISVDGYETAKKNIDLEAGDVKEIALKKTKQDKPPDLPPTPPNSIELAIQYLTLAKDHEAKEVLRHLINTMTDSQKITVSGIINEHDKPNANFNKDDWRGRSISKLKSL